MKHNIRCKCGSIRGHVHGKGINNRVVCYCSDCQAFAKFLECQNEVLDTHGGTEIVQVAQARVNFSQGKEHLAILRLSKKGLIRWYAACCKTPIGNTLSNPKISFIGLIHSALDRAMIDQDFGKNIAIVNVNAATGEPKPEQKGLLGATLRFLWIILSMRIGGQYKKSELFNESGKLIVSPTVLTAEERGVLKKTL
jgi:hypothetical protein